VRSDQGLAFLSPPASWTYPAFTPIEEDFNRWKLEEYFSEFCVLYVALTRAKQALYCVLEKPKSKKRKQKDSLADWIIETLPDHNVKDEGMLFQRGDSNWFSQIEEKVLPDVDSSTLEINLSKKRSRSTKSKQFRRTAFSDSCGIEQGLQVHDLLECVDWLPAYPEPLPEDFVMVLDHFEQGATYVAKFMLPEIRKLFIKPKGEHKLFREQSIEWIGKDGLWNTVRLDRFVVHYDQGTPVKIQLIDYKTDKAGSLEGKYEAQMRHYEEGLKTIYGEVPIETHLLAIGMSFCFDDLNYFFDFICISGVSD